MIQKIVLFLIFVAIFLMGFFRIAFTEQLQSFFQFPNNWLDTVSFGFMFSLLNILFVVLFLGKRTLKYAIVYFFGLQILVFAFIFLYKKLGGDFLYHLSENMISAYFSVFPLFLYIFFGKLDKNLK